MAYHVDDTIAAIASARGGAARGIVRVSGPQTVPVLQQCFRSETRTPLDSMRVARVLSGTVDVGEPLAHVPCALYLWPNERSYTRQPAGELHTIGSPPVLEAIVRAVCASGARIAQPGEFTLRAFLAGRLDLTQVEAVLGVVDATQEDTLAVALRQLAGGLATPLHQLQTHLLDLLAHVEAGLDFADEDIELLSVEQLTGHLDALAETLGKLRTQMASRVDYTDRPRVVLRGWPNTGKSSLFNALAGTDAAIVSSQPGTTRDYVTCHVRWGDIACVLVDTAGTEASRPTEMVAVAADQMTRQQTDSAELAIVCLDSTRPFNQWERQLLNTRGTSARMIALTKIDVSGAPHTCVADAVATSSRTGEGIERLRQAVCQRLRDSTKTMAGVVPATAARCHGALESADLAIGRAQRLAVTEAGDELVSAELREALDHIGQVVGAVYAEDVLDRIFERFCLGK